MKFTIELPPGDAQALLTLLKSAYGFTHRIGDDHTGAMTRPDLARVYHHPFPAPKSHEEPSQ